MNTPGRIDKLKKFIKDEYTTFIDKFDNLIPNFLLSSYAKPVSIDQTAGNQKIHLNITIIHEHLFPTTEQQNQTQIENELFLILEHLIYG